MGNLARCLALAWWACWAACPGDAHREHKVHNIVLYPDKESWCKTTPIKQVVTWASCLPQELDNNVCVGACFSYMVPHSEPSAPGDLIRPYCDSCQPLDSIWHTVTLQCRDKDGGPTSMQKKVQIITNCSCSSCAESERIKPDLNSLLQSLELQSARRLDGAGPSEPPPGPPPQPAPGAAAGAAEAAAPAPPPAPPAPSGPQSPAPGAAQTEPPAAEASQQPRPQLQRELPDLLLDPHLNASARPGAPPRAPPADRLLRLFKQLDEPGRPADPLAGLGALGDLDKLDQLAAEEAGAKELLAKLGELLHEYRRAQPEAPAGQPEAARPEGPGEPAAAAAPELPKDEDDEEVPSLQDQQLRVAASLLQRTGPHHSLVLDAGVKEKIDVDSHYLHPALAGQEISYHDNLLLDKAKKKDF